MGIVWQGSLSLKTRSFLDFCAPRLRAALADLLVAKLGPVSSEMRRLLADPAEIDRTLAAGAARARALAAPILAETMSIVGFTAGR